MQPIETEDWRRQVTAVLLTLHAQKRLQRRFGIESDEAAHDFVWDFIRSAHEVFASEDGGLIWRRGDQFIVTKPLYDQGTHLVLTCYSRSTMARVKSRRRARYKQLKRALKESPDREQCGI